VADVALGEEKRFRNREHYIADGWDWYCPGRSIKEEDMATAAREIGIRKGAKPRVSRAERMEWFFRARRGPDGQFPKRGFAKALQQRLRAEREQLKREMDGAGAAVGGQPGGMGSVNWQPIGPSVIASFGSSVSGRITCLVAGPGSSRIYAGADNGGIWSSGDGGATWAPLDDFVVSPAGSKFSPRADALAVGSIAVKFGAGPANDEIYVGTGGSNAYFGIGVLHSLSGGAPGSWALEATNLDDNGIGAITIDPDNPAVVLAATWQGLFQRPTAGSPATWNHLTSPAFTNANNLATSLIVAGSGAGKTYYAAFYGDQVYSSPDGTTWKAIPGIAGGSERIALGAGESDPTAVYAFASTGLLYRLHNNSFQVVNGTPPANVLWPVASQHNFDLAVAVDPSNGNTVYLAAEYQSGLALFKGTLSGGPGSYNFGFTNVANPSLDATYIGSGIHPDGHAIAFGLNALGTAHDPAHVWVGCDGGVYGSTSSGSNGSFKPYNTGLAIAELYYLAQRADTDAVMFAGTQDNGTVRYLGEAAEVEPTGGDGGGVAVDPNNPYQVMGQQGFYGADLFASSDGGFGFGGLTFPPITANTPAQTGAAATESGNTNAFAAIATSPAGVVPTIAVFGTNRLWITKNWGGAWTTLPTNTNPYTPAVPDLNQDVIDATAINAITFASGTRIFAATGRSVWRYDFDSVMMTWSRTVIDTSTLPNQRYITGLAVDNAAAGSFYATLGYGVGIAHLYYFDGAAWTAAMPAAVIDVSTNTVAVDPVNLNSLYVGTDVGCYRGTHTGPGAWTWQLFSQGLPECVVMDLKIFQTPSGERILRAATYGRGLWEIMLSNATVYNPDIYTRANYCDSGRVTGGVRNSWIENLPDPTRKTFVVYHYMSPDIKVRRGSLPSLPLLGSPVTYLDFAVNIGDYSDFTTNTETVDLSGPNRFFVQVHNRDPITSVPGAQVKVLLLLADAFAGPPALPANYASHINAGDTGFLGGSQWYFADAVSPYRTVSGTLDARNPQVVEFDVDMSSAIPGLPAGHDHVCAAAFVTTSFATEQITATDPSIDVATMQDKHVAQRNLHLVTLGTTPIGGGREGFRQYPEVALLDFHNAQDEELAVDIVFERAAFPGHISVMLPKLPELTRPGALDGFKMVAHKDGLLAGLRSLLGEALEHAGEALENLGETIEKYGPLADAEPDEAELTPRDRRTLRKLATLDRSRLFVAEGSPNATLKGIRIPAGGFITGALILQAPDNAVPGNKFAFNVIQRHAGKILGGSGYIVAVTKQRPAALKTRRAAA
jgi:hypothetical protein